MKHKGYKGILIVLVIGIICYIFVRTGDLNRNITNTKIYKTNYYSIDLPANWEYRESNDYQTSLYLNNKNVGSIMINADCNYNSNITSIITNWIGMSAYAKGDVIENKFDGYKMEKGFIGFELTAAQQEKGNKPEPDQLHYFYTKNNLLIDLYINSNKVDENDADKIANTLIVK
jgi:hypothetical protein